MHAKEDPDETGDGEDASKNEEFEDDGGVLEEGDALEGEEEYDEDVLNGEEEQLLGDESMPESEEGEVALEDEGEENQEELYEPSEVQFSCTRSPCLEVIDARASICTCAIVYSRDLSSLFGATPVI